MCIKSNPSDVNQFIRWLFALSYVLLSLISLPRRSINQSQGPGMHCSSAVLLCHTRSTAPHSPTWGKRTDSQQIVPARPPSALFQAAEACDKCAKAPIRLAKCRQGFRSGTKDGQQHKKSPMMHSRCLFHLGRALRASPHVSNPWVHPRKALCSHAHPTPPFSITSSSTITVYDGKGTRLG